MHDLDSRSNDKHQADVALETVDEDFDNRYEIDRRIFGSARMKPTKRTVSLKKTSNLTG